MKKAYVRLATDYDALDVANKVSNLLEELSGVCLGLVQVKDKMVLRV